MRSFQIWKIFCQNFNGTRAYMGVAHYELLLSIISGYTPHCWPTAAAQTGNGDVLKCRIYHQAWQGRASQNAWCFALLECVSTATLCILHYNSDPSQLVAVRFYTSSSSFSPSPDFSCSIRLRINACVKLLIISLELVRPFTRCPKQGLSPLSPDSCSRHVQRTDYSELGKISSKCTHCQLRVSIPAN